MARAVGRHLMKEAGQVESREREIKIEPNTAIFEDMDPLVDHEDAYHCQHAACVVVGQETTRGNS